MIKIELIKYGFNNFVSDYHVPASISIIIRRFLINLLLFVISFPLFSQSLFESKFKPFLLDIDNASDIRTLNLDSLEFWTYNQVPDLSHLSVDNRKQKFIDLILPSILIEKSKIKTAYNYVLDNFDNIYLDEITEPLYAYCNCISRYELLLCLTDHPTSIIIAQAAIESGWGTSRFFVEGFNLFGIHAHKSNEAKIKANGSGDAEIYVKKYNSISSSIFDYLRTLANGYAYNDFRKIRVEPVDVTDMIKYLDHYSERRELYINDLELIIEYNKLVDYDNLEIYFK